jgi:hypothetical protein
MMSADLKLITDCILLPPVTTTSVVVGLATIEVRVSSPTQLHSFEDGEKGIHQENQRIWRPSYLLAMMRRMPNPLWRCLQGLVPSSAAGFQFQSEWLEATATSFTAEVHKEDDTISLLPLPALRAAAIIACNPAYDIQSRFTEG